MVVAQHRTIMPTARADQNRCTHLALGNAFRNPLGQALMPARCRQECYLFAQARRSRLPDAFIGLSCQVISVARSIGCIVCVVDISDHELTLDNRSPKIFGVNFDPGGRAFHSINESG